MIELAQANLPTLASALLIGTATGWWMFNHRRRRPAEAPDTDPDNKA